jgi:hypothetical protein
MFTMKFTDRFIKIPIRTYSPKQNDLMGKDTSKETWEAFLPFEISNYYPAPDSEIGEGDYTLLHLKNGHSFMVYVSPEEFEKILNDHQK